MKKLPQNQIAESSFTLPLTAAITFVVWLLSGLVAHGWWGQLVCFIASTYLMIELSNSHALLRVRSRLVSCTFMAFTCASCFLLGSFAGGIVQLCAIATMIILFHCYQDNQMPGWTFYAFLSLGMASLVWVQTLFYVPVVWLLMAMHLQSLSWRSWVASLLGLLTPYWFASLYFIYMKDFSSPVNHFMQLVSIPFSYDYSVLPIGYVVAFAIVVALTLLGVVHFWLYSFEDKIRIRQFYAFFTAISFATMFFLMLQPQHYEVLMRVLTVSASPIVAHFFAHTRSRISNGVFIASIIAIALLTLLNLLVYNMAIFGEQTAAPWTSS